MLINLYTMIRHFQNKVSKIEVTLFMKQLHYSSTEYYRAQLRENKNTPNWFKSI